MTRYVPLAYSIAADHYIPGTDYQDVRQEALIGLLKAARSYDPSKGGFPAFARLCISRRIWQEIKNARRGKQQPLTNAERDWDAPDIDLEERVEQRARLRRILASLGTLSELERRAVANYLNGDEYAQDKALDNALQRARGKLRAA